MAIRRASRFLPWIADTQAEIPSSGLETDRLFVAKDTGVLVYASSSTAKLTLGGAEGPQGPQGNTGAQGPPGTDASANMDGGAANSTYGGAITVEGGNASGT